MKGMGDGRWYRPPGDQKVYIVPDNRAGCMSPACLLKFPLSFILFIIAVVPLYVVCDILEKST